MLVSKVETETFGWWYQESRLRLRLFTMVITLVSRIETVKELVSRLETETETTQVSVSVSRPKSRSALNDGD